MADPSASRPDVQRSSAAYETSIGITARVSSCSKLWSGSLRHRWTDFMVNEISKDGTVVYLTDCHLGTPQKKNKSQDKAGQHTPQVERPDIPAEQLKTLEQLAGEDFSRQVLELYKTPTLGKDGKPSRPPPFTSKPISDKTIRSQIHNEVRNIFSSLIDTTTTHGCIEASLVTNQRSRGRNDRARHNKVNCPGTGDFVHFSLFKENRDTVEAVQSIRKMLNLRSNVTFAGTKDRRAATTQRCSAKLRSPHELSALNASLIRIRTGDYERRPQALRLGELAGNEFTIVVKNCHLTDTDATTSSPVAERVEALQAAVDKTRRSMYEHGWINYFGHQRFGSRSIGTQKIGMLIMGGKLEEAVRAILAYDPQVLDDAEVHREYKASGRHDEYYRALAIKTFDDTGDPTASLKQLPTRFVAERAIIGHLGRAANTAKDFPGALLKCPRALRTLYLHSFQSFVWNHAASRRWELYGAKVVEGDLVAVTDAPAAARTDQDTADDDPVAVNDDDDEVDADTGHFGVHVVTAEEASAGTFKVEDVVLPQPGYGTRLPTNDVGGFYRDFMAKPENGAMDPDAMPRGHRDFTAEGKYRRILARFLAEPEVVVRGYADDDEQLFPTDLERVAEAQQGLKKKEEKKEEKKAGGEEQTSLDGKRPREEEAEGDVEGAAGPVAKKVKMDSDKAEGEPVAASNGEAEAGIGESAPKKEKGKIAVIIKCQLGRSAYATVVTRELGLSGDEAS